MLTARYSSYFHENITGVHASQTDLLKIFVFYGELIDSQ